MEWKWLLLGVVLGILLMPTLLMLGLRLMARFLMRRLRKTVQQMEEAMARGETTSPYPGVQMWSWGTAVQNPVGPALAERVGEIEIVDAEDGPPPTLPSDAELEGQFLSKTGLSGEEWAAIREQVAFVHDGLSDQELEERGFVDLPEQGTPRQRVRQAGQGQFLGSLSDPVDVYRL